MDDGRQHLVAAMTTEHFVMQTAISTSVSEQQTRASMYLYALSSALVAIGFLAQSPQMMVFVAAVLPVIFVIGLLTTLRLIDIGMESLAFHLQIAEVRAFYREIGGDAVRHFAADKGRWPEVKAVPSLKNGLMLGGLTTAASMISAVNAFVAGTGVALLVTRFADLSLVASVAIGAALGVALVASLHKYQLFRVRGMDALAAQRGISTAA